MSGNRFEPQDWAEFMFEQSELEREMVTDAFGTVADFQRHVEDIISDMHDAIGCEGADVHTDSMLAIGELRGDGSGLWEDREQHHATLRDMLHACTRVSDMLERLGLDWSQQSVAKYLGVFGESKGAEAELALNRRMKASTDAYTVYLANCREAGTLPALPLRDAGPDQNGRWS